MMTKEFARVLVPGIALALGILVPSASAGVVNINFDEFTSPPVTGDYITTGVIGPLVYPQVTITDASGAGYVMNGDGWNGQQTSGYNLFGTESGEIVLTFNIAVSNLDLDVINGRFDVSPFTLTAYDNTSALIAYQTQYLNSYATSGSVVNFATPVGGIWSATIVGDGDFAIDTVSFNTSSSVPEPSFLLLLGPALAGMGFMRRFRRSA